MNYKGISDKIHKSPGSFWHTEQFCHIFTLVDQFLCSILHKNITKNAPYAWGNFHASAITRFQKPQQLSWAGRGQRAGRSARAQRAETRSQQPAWLQTAAETTAGGSTGKEDLKADRRVRHYKEVGLQEWPLAGRATIPRVLYGISLCMSLRRRTILSKSLRAPAPVDLTIHTFRTVDRTAGRCFVSRFGKR